jgi:hypothetical protein|nr:hypothetical protein [Pseudomonas chengduensis]
MAKTGTYYAGRVLKLGTLDQSMLMDAIRKPTSVLFRGNAWTFIDIIEHNQAGNHYIFGRLSKYAPKGEIGVVDEKTRSEKKQIEPNLLVASSPFVYIPEHSGIAFLHVSNNIETQTFIKRFSEIIEATHLGFFVDCDIELVSDLKTFSAKLSTLDGIYKIDARVSPPNPLFSPLWKPLEQYLRSRNTDRMTITEDAPTSESLHTDLPTIIEAAAKQTENEPFIPDTPLAIGDAAILMAADGYGSGTIRGKRENEIVVIKTSETALNFTHDKIPNPFQLYKKALKIFKNIQNQRHMEHGN